MTTKISFSIFNNISCADNGGALRFSNTPLSIKKCFFAKCSAKTFGGAIFTDGCDSKILNCVFYWCTTGHVDGNYGNAVCCNNQRKIIVEKLSVCCCGPSTDCGDSSLKFENGMHKVKFINCSKNIDECGGGLAIFFKADEGTAIKFSQAIECSTYNTVQTWYSELLVSNVNFIKCKASQITYARYEKAKVNFESCLFYELSYSMFASGSYSASNCYSDKYISESITEQSDPTYPTNRIFYENAVSARCNNNNKNQYVYLMIFLFVC